MLPLLISLLLVYAQFAVPRRIAFLPLLIAAFHVGNLTLISEFTPVRLVILAGLARAVFGGFFNFSPRNRLDLVVLIFSGIALFSSVGHESNRYVPSPLIERCGLVLNVLGTYAYARAYCVGQDFLFNFSKCLAWVVIPFAILMAAEQATGRNYYSSLGARSEYAGMRNDRFRAKGPFGHAILAGTAAATAFPFMVFLRRRKKMLGTVGMGAAFVGAFASASSGPVAAFMAIVGLLVLWRWRHWLGKLKACTALLLIVLNFAMSRPIWFLIARIDLVGGSTGWHRSKLIDTAMKRLNEWWLFGTDHTRHWMFSGVTWNPNHTDITNYYLQLGVWGGLPLLFAFLAIIIIALRQLEQAWPTLRELEPELEFGSWCLWAAILGHCVSFISISYFDQSYALFFILIGAAAALTVEQVRSEAVHKRDEEEAEAGHQRDLASVPFS